MDAVPVQDYEYVLGDLDLWLNAKDLDISLGEKGYTISVDNVNYEVSITEKESGRSIVFELKPFIATLEDTGPARAEISSIESLTMVQESDFLKVKLVFSSINGQRQGEEITSVTANFGLYFSLPDQ